MKKFFLIRRVVGESMLPLFRPGQIVLGWNYGAVKKGDVVIMSHEELDKLKRVHHIEGDNVFVVGDNLSRSKDSREFGSVHRAQVRARIVWPRPRSNFTFQYAESDTPQTRLMRQP